MQTLSTASGRFFFSFSGFTFTGKVLFGWTEKAALR